LTDQQVLFNKTKYDVSSICSEGSTWIFSYLLSVWNEMEMNSGSGRKWSHRNQSISKSFFNFSPILSLKDCCARGKLNMLKLLFECYPTLWYAIRGSVVDGETYESIGRMACERDQIDILRYLIESRKKWIDVGLATEKSFSRMIMIAINTCISCGTMRILTLITPFVTEEMCVDLLRDKDNAIWLALGRSKIKGDISVIDWIKDRIYFGSRIGEIELIHDLINPNGIIEGLFEYAQRLLKRTDMDIQPKIRVLLESCVRSGGLPVDLAPLI